MYAAHHCSKPTTSAGEARKVLSSLCIARTRSSCRVGSCEWLSRSRRRQAGHASLSARVRVHARVGARVNWPNMAHPRPPRPSRP
eukprot:scaffold14520_cov63-Phaeocystis_antarctica.AAC.2